MLIMQEKDMSAFVNRQIYSLYGKTLNLDPYQQKVLERLEKCFTPNNSKYYSQVNCLIFSPLHTVQYSIYLYFLANVLYMQGVNADSPNMLYCLNKALHNVDWFYEIELPAVFCAEHPIGSVMGRAKYSDYFFFYQGCTVGGSGEKYPTLGERVVMYSNCSILGDSHIGKNVILGAGTQIINANIFDNCFVFGHSPELTIIPKDEEYMLNRMMEFWK